MGQRAAKPLDSPPPAPPPPPPVDGWLPRREAARVACNPKRVRRLIQAGRLGPCWMPLDGTEGEECCVCLEEYARVNKTACCHQDLCTECFISVVAPTGGLRSRCPYCCAAQLQVFLPPRPERAVELQPGDARAEEAPAPAAPAALAAERSCSTASSALSELDSEESSGVGGSSCLAAALRSAPALSPSASKCQCSICMAASSSSSSSSSSGSLQPLFAPDTRALAEAAAAAVQQQGPAVVAMVLPGSSTGPAAAAAAGEPAAAAAAAEPPPAAGEPSEPPSPGPALLLNPDGTEQLVLLSSGQPDEPAGQQAQQQPAERAEAAELSYRAPSTAEDERVVQAIAAADAALQSHQPPAGAGATTSRPRAQDDWLARLQAADAALRGAVARHDAQHFGSTAEQPSSGASGGPQ